MNERCPFIEIPTWVPCLSLVIRKQYNICFIKYFWQKFSDPDFYMTMDFLSRTGLKVKISYTIPKVYIEDQYSFHVLIKRISKTDLSLHLL